MKPEDNRKEYTNGEIVIIWQPKLCVHVWKCCSHTNDSTPMATSAVMAAMKANAAVTRVVYVRLSQPKRMPRRFLPSLSCGTTMGPVVPVSASTVKSSTTGVCDAVSCASEAGDAACSLASRTSVYCATFVGSSKR